MKILFPFDGSDNAKAALNLILKRQWPLKTKVHVVTIVEHVPIVDTWMKLSPQEAQNLLEKATTSLQDKFGKQGVQVRVMEGEPRTEILNVEKQLKPDCIIMGSHGRHGLTRFFLGSLTDVVVNYASSSVCVVRPPSSNRRETKFLVAIEGSKHSLAALKNVIQRPWSADVEFRLVSVVESPLKDYSYSPVLALETVRKAEKEMRLACQQFLENQASRVREQLPKNKVSCAVIQGHAVDSILAVAKSWQPDCIVMGTRGGRGLDALVMGSVSKGVLMQAPCSVEIVRGAGADKET